MNGGVVFTQSEAKRFLVERVLARARAEQVVLSEAERRMLSWSESDPDFVADPQLAEQLASEIPDDAYEKKVAGLLARGFAADVAENSEAAEQWRQAANVLRDGDHYIIVMLDAAFPAGLKRRWKFWR